MKLSIFALAAFMASVPLKSVADGSCTLNGVPVPDTQTTIEGTNNADEIICSGSTIRREIYGGGGADLLIGSDSIDGDFIAGGGGNDTIYGGWGPDAIDGGANDDTIYGEEDDDVIFGGVGSAPASGVGCTLQTAFIALGSSYLTKGGSGDDTIYGGDGNDCIDAGSGEDLVYGDDGNDTLEGGNHGDRLEGGLGDDWIDGGWHSDTCIGGKGEDTFVNCELDDGSDPVCPDSDCDAFGEDSCSCALDCGAPPDFEESCTDEKDNDCDTFVDCDDDDCSFDPACDNSCTLADLGESCDSNSDCCSDKCKGKRSSKTCR